MSKRKQQSGQNDGEDSDMDIDQVDFDFFDPDPEVDYLAIKTFSTQLWQGDAAQLDIPDMAELILAQPEVGTTVKSDGKESDPLSILTVINLHAHQSRPFVKTLVEYALKGSRGNDKAHAAFQELLGPAGLQSQKHVGFVFSERFVNMPVQTVPPMYRMLEEELSWAIESNKPFKFSHLLFLSRTYRVSTEEAAELEERANKRQKATPSLKENDLIPIHPEDEQIAQASERLAQAVHAIDEAYPAS
ncbi:hypothetical protein PHLGIDRAFT_121089 [Phlebiopsis gigantea 11061_1 CR5-6]|uniref:Protein BCP1 n=1 Tax=Phlebiopsis gigantea (strain 11061_1 CR5-6) TaxID=745531 RepID=A0A0C3RTI5_PHLG1|nr:hypothetical protein PHLGIDRAFT_121089 [Phlebiopsis gigantea 11061_1 CR5-6]